MLAETDSDAELDMVVMLEDWDITSEPDDPIILHVLHGCISQSCFSVQ